MPPWTGRIGDYLALPILLAAVPTAGFLVGWFLDRKLHTFPWLTVSLLIGGFIGAAREVWRMVKELESKKRRQP
ncbi:MAG: AtpZ/AtpI family protein [Candidatus Omnitrophica bacterium]|nr:AtpZ/AtpI family protein [Candidatus Omnitrophota bacterium]